MITNGQGKQILVFSVEILQLIMMSSDFADNQSHYIEVMQGAIFIEQENEIWSDFGPVGNTEKKVLADYEPLLCQFFKVFMGILFLISLKIS